MPSACSGLAGRGHDPGEFSGRVELGQILRPGLDLVLGPAGPPEHGDVVFPQEPPHQAAERQALLERAAALKVGVGDLPACSWAWLGRAGLEFAPIASWPACPNPVQ
jgi:hypothetical protein